MNDRFKFRFWNKTRKIMETFNNSPLTLGGLLLGKNDDYEILSCTGLKDKNGKLIYEGDIIKIPDDYETYGQFACEKREVCWNEGFRLKPKWDARARGNWLEDTKDLEVIGNIYENKELLDE